MTAAPARTALADTYPAPSNAQFKAGIGTLWDFITGTLGTTGAKNDALAGLRILDPLAIYNMRLVATIGSGTLTLTVKNLANAAPSDTDPVMLAQRSTPASVGAFALRLINSAVSLTISAGSTLGHSNGVEGIAYWYLIDYAGAQELAVSSAFFGLSGIASTTSEGGAGGADSGSLMYSSTARANVAFRCVGRTKDTQAVAGSYLALPSEVAVGSPPAPDRTDLITTGNIAAQSVSYASSAGTAGSAGTAAGLTGTPAINVAAVTATTVTASGAMTSAGNITAYYSDDRLKTRLGAIEHALDKVATLDSFYYEANALAQSMGYEPVREVGLSAQQVQAVMPEVVAPAPVDPEYLTIRYERLLALAFAAINELRTRVDQQ